jgi:hypothetical protein
MENKLQFESYISGFTDGEGCFCVSFNLREKLKTKIEVRPSFSISQKKHSLKLLQQINKHFACGSIRYSKSDGTYKYEVRNIADLNNRIIPHFVKYPLQSAKYNDFLRFQKVCLAIQQNLHLSKKFLPDIILTSYEMNLSGKRKYKMKELLKLLT